MTQPLTLITPTCTCCPKPTALLPRDDLAEGLAVCGQSGQLYRPVADGYIPTAMPTLSPARRRPASVQIDLSRNGYA